MVWVNGINVVNQAPDSRQTARALESVEFKVVVDAFSLLYRDADFSDAQTEIENVVLTAADVDHLRFNEQFK